MPDVQRRRVTAFVHSVHTLPEYSWTQPNDGHNRSSKTLVRYISHIQHLGHVCIPGFTGHGAIALRGDTSLREKCTGEAATWRAPRGQSGGNIGGGGGSERETEKKREIR